MQRKSLRVVIRRKFSGHKNYIFFRQIYRGFFNPSKIFAKNSIIFIAKLIRISVVFDKYSILDEPKFSRHILVAGLNGPVFMGKKIYLSKNTFKINYKNDAKIHSYLSEIKDFYNNTVIPNSILQAAIIPEGRFEVFDLRKNPSGLITHVINPGSNKKVFIPLEQSFFHFYIQIVPFILQNFSDSSIYLQLDSATTNLEILNCLGIWPKEFSEISLEDFKNMKIAKQVNLYPAKSEVVCLRKHLDYLGIERAATQNIYITRAGNINGRRVKNEIELLEVLKNFDFICIDPNEMPFQEQLKIFSNANMVIAPHGAALSHLVCFPATVKILELNSNRDIRWHIRKMCRDLNLSHKLLLGLESEQGSFNVNLNLVEDFLLNN